MLIKLFHWLTDHHHDRPAYHPLDDLYDKGRGWPKQMKLF